MVWKNLRPWKERNIMNKGGENEALCGPKGADKIPVKYT